MSNILDIKEGEVPEEGSPEKYTEITVEPLNLEDTILNLFDGKIILLTTYDNDKSQNILVRFKETNNGTVTQVSRPANIMAGFSGGKKYWTLNDVSLNTLSMYPTYVYDPVLYNLDYKYAPNTIVHYTKFSGEEDVAIVTGIFMDESDNFHYTLSGQGELLYKETEIEQVEENRRRK